MTTNLVHNAIVHNLPEHGTVSVNTSVRPNSVVLTVENTGEKLTPHLVSTLVEPFQRGTERIRTDHVGVGLGLAIVKSITQAHDGILAITPRTGGGLHVTVQLPATPTHSGSIEAYWETADSPASRCPEPVVWGHGRREMIDLMPPTARIVTAADHGCASWPLLCGALWWRAATGTGRLVDLRVRYPLHAAADPLSAGGHRPP